jgi:hypothetical protein
MLRSGGATCCEQCTITARLPTVIELRQHEEAHATPVAKHLVHSCRSWYGIRSTHVTRVVLQPQSDANINHAQK